MKKNETGFPDYLELRSKLDLDNNKVLKEYIYYMYDTYNQLYNATSNMTPEEIKFIKNLRYLRSTLMTIYEDELKNCKSITEINNDILASLMNETATRNIFKAYIRKCIDYLNRNIESLFSKYETKCKNKDKTTDEEMINNEKILIEVSYNKISKYSKEIEQYKQKLSEAEKNLESEKARLSEYLNNIISDYNRRNKK